MQLSSLRVIGKKQRGILYGFLEDDNALAYPALISNMNPGRISKPTAKSSCESLNKLGLLAKRRCWIHRHGLSSHYYLKRDLDTFVKLIKVLGIEHSTTIHDSFIRSRYVQRQIDSNLVRTRLEALKHFFRVTDIKDESKSELPLLTLIQISTNALVEFLFGQSTPYVDRSQPFRLYSLDPVSGRTIAHRRIASIDHIIFKLVFLTINDLMKYGKVLPIDSIVEFAKIAGGREKKRKKEAPILSLYLKDKRIIHFDGGTDTTPWEITDIPTDADYWLKWWVEDLNTKEDKTFNSQLINSSKWRQMIPEKARFPAMYSIEKIIHSPYLKLIS